MKGFSKEQLGAFFNELDYLGVYSFGEEEKSLDWIALVNENQYKCILVFPCFRHLNLSGCSQDYMSDYLTYFQNKKGENIGKDYILFDGKDKVNYRYLTNKKNTWIINKGLNLDEKDYHNTFTSEKICIVNVKSVPENEKNIKFVFESENGESIEMKESWCKKVPFLKKLLENEEKKKFKSEKNEKGEFILKNVSFKTMQILKKQIMSGYSIPKFLFLSRHTSDEVLEISSILLRGSSDIACRIRHESYCDGEYKNALFVFYKNSPTCVDMLVSFFSPNKKFRPKFFLYRNFESFEVQDDSVKNANEVFKKFVFPEKEMIKKMEIILTFKKEIFMSLTISEDGKKSIEWSLTKLDEFKYKTYK